MKSLGLFIIEISPKTVLKNSCSCMRDRMWTEIGHKYIKAHLQVKRFRLCPQLSLSRRSICSLDVVESSKMSIFAQARPVVDRIRLKILKGTPTCQTL